MQRMCFLMEIVAGQEAEGEGRHAEIWPELVAALQDAGVGNYTLFRRGTSVIATTMADRDVILEHDDLRLLAALATGLPTHAVARTLSTSARTVQRRTREVCDRIGVRTTVEAVAWAARRHLI